MTSEAYGPDLDANDRCVQVPELQHGSEHGRLFLGTLRNCLQLPYIVIWLLRHDQDVQSRSNRFLEVVLWVCRFLVVICWFVVVEVAWYGVAGTGAAGGGCVVVV